MFLLVCSVCAMMERPNCCNVLLHSRPSTRYVKPSSPNWLSTSQSPFNMIFACSASAKSLTPSSLMVFRSRWSCSIAAFRHNIAARPAAPMSPIPLWPKNNSFRLTFSARDSARQRAPRSPTWLSVMINVRNVLLLRNAFASSMAPRLPMPLECNSSVRSLSLFAKPSAKAAAPASPKLLKSRSRWCSDVWDLNTWARCAAARLPM
mmetsp:Transcript_14079/g.38522  ORF Transcript_14079/g.38522 Transcript_14079/m.38522 type:complete len:206 (-) Transcript_14079:344-961(-)